MHLCSFAPWKLARVMSAWVLFIGIALGVADVASAQVTGIKPAPIAIRNQSNTTLTFRLRTVENEFGTYKPSNLALVVQPGQYLYFQDATNGKVLARKYTYDVETSGRSTNWTAALSQVDEFGYFYINFTQGNLQTHLAMQNTPTLTSSLPPPHPLPIPSGYVPPIQSLPISSTTSNSNFLPSGMPNLGGGVDAPSNERMLSAAIKICIAAAADRSAQQVRSNPQATFVQQLGGAFVQGVRDGMIQSTLGDLFPSLSPTERADIQFLISEAADGRLGFFTYDQQAAKARLMERIRQRNPNVGNAAAIADFLWFVHQNRR